MKKLFSFALITLFLLSFNVQVFVFAQQKTQTLPIGSPSAGRPPAGPYNGNRRSSRSAGTAIPLIEKDFDEALRVIQENYIEGKKLDYNTVFKSSIIGMLRSLDPHSNYYDREEYEELKTDQRSEYFGIGASIQNYLIREQIDTFITATFQNSPAARAGLRESKRGRGTVVPGDVLQEIDGKPVTTSDEFLGRLGHYRPGDTVTLTVWRDGQVRRVKTVLEAAE